MRAPKDVLCDIDGVLGDVTPPIVQAINQEFGTDYQREDWTDWEWPLERLAVLAGLDIPAAAAWAFSMPHVSAAVPIPEAQKVLKDWSEQGTHIHVATSRSASHREITMDWLARHYPFISPEDIHVRVDKSVNGTDFKKQQAEVLQPSLYFEDEGAAMMALLAIWPENLKAILKLIDQPWNRSFTELEPYRTSWGDLR